MPKINTQYALPEGFQWLTPEQDAEQKKLALEAKQAFYKHLQGVANTLYPEAESQALPPGQRPTTFNPDTGRFEEVSPALAAQAAVPLGPPRETGEHAPEGGVIFSSEPWRDLGASNEPGVPAWYTPPKLTKKEQKFFDRLSPQEKEDFLRDNNPYPLPTLLSPETGQMEEVDPRWARKRGIPIGEPRPGGEGPRPSGGPEMPLNESRSRDFGGPTLLASSGKGLPEGFQWMGQDDPAVESSAGYQEGLASTFGYNDPEDSGVGAWGDNTNDPNAFGVSLPISTLRAVFGDDDAAHRAVVEVQNPANGKTVRAPIIDKGPANWVIDRQGPTIDVTEGVRRALGHGGGTEPMNWRILGHGAPVDSPEGGFSATTGLPEGLQWVSDTDTAKPVSGDTTGLPEGIRWISDEEARKQTTAPEPGTRQAKVAENRKQLIDAIAAVEEGGYPVDHKIGKPDEPEGDRSPTQDMEHLVEALKIAERDALADGNKEGAVKIAKGRLYWENKIKTEGMTQEQADAAEKKAAQGPARYVEGKKPSGMVEQGNIDISHRPIVHNPDGSVSTELSVSINENGKEVLIPTVIKGKIVGIDQAVDYYHQTNQHLGKFDSVDAADAYAQTLHEREDPRWVSSPAKEAEKKKGFPHQTLGEELDIKRRGEMGDKLAQMAQTGEAPAEDYPRVSVPVADKMGLSAWRDLESGTMIRRASYPDVKVARRAHEYGDQPYEMGYNPEAKTYGLLNQEERDFHNWARNDTGLKALQKYGITDQDFLKWVRDDTGAQALLRTIRGVESIGYDVPIGTYRFLDTWFNKYRNPYQGATAEKASNDIPKLQSALEAAQQRAMTLAAQKKTGSREMQEALQAVAKLGIDLKYAEQVAGGETTERWEGSLSRAGHKLMLDWQQSQSEAEKKYAATINKGMDQKMAMQVADSMGASVGGIVALAANPAFGAFVMAAQQFKQSTDEMTESYAKQGKAPPTPEELNQYGTEQTLKQIPQEFAGDMVTLGAFKSIAAAFLKPGISTKEYIKKVVAGVVSSGIGEGATQAGQTQVQERVAEKYGVQAPTTEWEKAKKTLRDVAIAELQTGALVGVPGMGGIAVRESAQTRLQKAQANFRTQMKAAIAQQRAAQAAPYSQGGVVPPVTGPATPSTGLFPHGPPAPAAPGGTIPDRFNALHEDARARVARLPIMQWEKAIGEEEKAAKSIIPEAVASGKLDQMSAENPTSDEELEAMKVALMGGHEKAAAFAKSAGVHDPADQRKLFAAMLPHFIKFKNHLQNMGINFELDAGDGSRFAPIAQVTWDEDTGKNVKMSMNPFSLTNRILKSSLSPEAELGLIGGEEVFHAADVTAKAKRFAADTSAPKGPYAFTDYLEEQSGVEFQGVEDAVGGATPEEQKVLHEGLADIAHIYLSRKAATGAGETESRAEYPADATIFDKIRGEHKTLTFMAEFARMVAQQRSQGAISEHTFRNTISAISDFYNQALRRVVTALPGADEGKFGAPLQQRVKDIRNQIAEWDAMLKLKGKPPAIRPLTAAERLTATAEKPQPSYKEAPPAKKPLVKAMQEMFGFVRQPSAAPGKKLTPAEKRARVQQQGMGAREGRGGKAETLNIGMQTDDGRGITPEQVEKALRDAGVNAYTRYQRAPTGEPTAVAYLEKALTPAQTEKLARDLNQQAIAAKFEGGEELYGPAAEQWRPFNENFFLNAREAPALSRSLEELDRIAKDYEGYKRWYEDFDTFLDLILGENKEYKPLITDFIAATSPGTEIGPNMRQAVDKLRQFMEEGTVTYHGLGHWPGAKLPNLRRAMEGMEKLHGPKVSPFSEALKGDPNAAAIDRHVAMILFNTRKPTEAQIKVGQQAAFEAAQRLGWTPRQVQAAWWAAGKAMFGERGKIVETYEQYLKEYQDELNAILTKDRQGTERGLQAARRLAERAGQRAGPARGGRGAPVRPGLQAKEAEEAGVAGEPPGKIEVSQVRGWHGGYFLSPDNTLHDVRSTAGNHHNYAERFLGETMRNALSDGWVRMFTDGNTKQLIWDGYQPDAAQQRTMRDMAQSLSYELVKSTTLPEVERRGLLAKEKKVKYKHPDHVDAMNVEEGGGYWMDRNGESYDVDAGAEGGGHPWYALTHLFPEEGNVADAYKRALREGWLRVVPTENDLYYNTATGEITNAQRRALKDIGANLGMRVHVDPISVMAKEGGYQPRVPEERNLPGEVSVFDLKKTGGYFFSPSGRIYDVRATGPTHYDFALDKMGISFPEAQKKGWLRVLTNGESRSLYWDGKPPNNIQFRNLKDAAAILGYDVVADPIYVKRARLGLGAKEDIAASVRVDPSQARKTAAYWMDRSGSLYDFHKLGISSHTHFAQDVLGMRNERQALMEGWVRIRTIGGTLGFGKQVMYQGTSLSNAQRNALADMSIYLGAELKRDTEGGMLGAREGLEARAAVPSTAAERPTMQPLVSAPFALHKTTLEGRKFAPHMTRPIWDWVNMHRFYSGTARLYDQIPKIAYMGRALRKFDDALASYRGEFRHRAVEGFKGTPRHVLAEYNQYWINNQLKGRNFADNQPISPRALKLVKLSKDLFREMGDRAVGKIKIYNPITKTWIPFRPRVDPFKDYHPHILREDIQRVLHNPASDPVAWHELQDQMIAEGIIPGIDPDAEMTKHVNNYMSKFTVNGFFGSMERVRIADFPTKAYDFSAKTLLNYIDSWAERMAQTEAFGQGTGGQKTLWDLALQDAGNKALVNHLKGTRDRVYNVMPESLLGRAAVLFNNIATGTQLGSFFYTGRNLVFGAGFNWAQFGTPTFARSILNFKGTFDEIRYGKEKGIIMDDMMNVMSDGGEGKWSGNLANWLLRVHGNNMVEAWLRGTATRGFRIILRQNINRYQKNPRGVRVRQFLGYLDNIGFKGEESHNLMMENGVGPLTDRYLRAAVKAVQGGYSVPYVPLLADSPEGRFWLKYSKFGIERLQDFALNVSKPFLRAARLPGTKQVVPIMDQNGNWQDVRVPANIVPMMRYFMVLAGAGAGWEWIAQNIFGIYPRTASWAEVLNTMKYDERLALVEAAEKIFGYLVQAGAVGIVGNYAQMGMDIAQRVNLKNPLDPAALAPLKEMGNAVLDFMDQGHYTLADVDKLATKVVSGYRRNKEIVAHALKESGIKYSPSNDIFGIHRALELTSRRQEYNFVRAATRRYDREIGARANVRSPGTYGKNPETSFRNAVNEDLILGDTKTASKRIEEHFKNWSPERQKTEWKNLQSSVAARQPIKAGAGGGDREAGRIDFQQWARVRLPADQMALVKRVDETYRKAAQGIKYSGSFLMKPEQIVPDIRLERMRQAIKVKAE